MQVKSLKKVENDKFDLILEVNEEEANFFVNIALDYLVGTIAIYEKSGKRSEKKIYSVKYTVTSPNSFIVEMRIDGGIPLKHFVNGENVFPNVSDLISNKCMLTQFDFEQIQTH
mgnify:CR=1 FL=1